MECALSEHVRSDCRDLLDVVLALAPYLNKLCE